MIKIEDPTELYIKWKRVYEKMFTSNICTSNIYGYIYDETHNDIERKTKVLTNQSSLTIAI